MPIVGLTADFVKRAKSTSTTDRTFFWDQKLPSFGLMVTATGHKSFVIQYRNTAGISRRMTIPGVLSVDDARKEAKAYLGQVAKRGDPLADRRAEVARERDSFRVVAENYLADRRGGALLRSAGQYVAILNRHVFPQIGKRPITEIKRSEIVAMLRRIDREGGPSIANLVLAIVRRIFNWYALGNDEFVSPIVRGMAFETQERERVLNDDELRAIWRAAGGCRGPWGLFIRFLLLTATRRREAAGMTRDEVRDGIWTIPASRYKTSSKSNRDVQLPLSQAAQDILAQIPMIGDCSFYFTVAGRNSIVGISRFKERFDADCGVADWTLHDLRRTARSLMSRAGVNADIAERCLGHLIPGVRGVYDRHRYEAEMRHAFEALASLIDNIVDPNPKVVQMRK